MTLSRIEPATFRLIAQCVNRLSHRVILGQSRTKYESDSANISKNKEYSRQGDSKVRFRHRETAKDKQIALQLRVIGNYENGEKIVFRL